MNPKSRSGELVESAFIGLVVELVWWLAGRGAALENSCDFRASIDPVNVNNWCPAINRILNGYVAARTGHESSQYDPRVFKICPAIMRQFAHGDGNGVTPSGWRAALPWCRILVPGCSSLLLAPDEFPVVSLPLWRN